MLAAIANFSDQGGNAQARLARYLTTPGGQAIFQAADSILALLGAHSTVVRLGAYYRTQADQNTINYFFGPEHQPSDTVAPSDQELATVSPLPPHINAVEDNLANARRNERAMITELVNENKASGTASPTVSFTDETETRIPPPTTVARRIHSHPIDPRRRSIISELAPLTEVSTTRSAKPRNEPQGSGVTTPMRQVFGAENLPDYGIGYDRTERTTFF